jgi:predicted regulator of Ras-like GTPase activity (Roadblock/LC7/MglB family)
MQQSLKNFFDQQLTKNLKDHCFLLLREDGHIIYRRSSDVKISHEVGALVAGLSQAASALCKFVDKEESDMFRFSSECGEKGFYIIPVSLNKNNYYLTVIFKAETNPSLMKMEARIFARNLEQLKIDHEQKKSSSKFLFDNLKDEEVDRLFASMENF